MLGRCSGRASVVVPIHIVVEAGDGIGDLAGARRSLVAVPVVETVWPNGCWSRSQTTCWEGIGHQLRRVRLVGVDVIDRAVGLDLGQRQVIQPGILTVAAFVACRRLSAMRFLPPGRTGKW